MRSFNCLWALIAALAVVSCSSQQTENSVDDVQTTFDRPATTPVHTRPGRIEIPIVTEGQEFSCTPTRVWDGDGPIWCREGPRIRLAGIAAREMDGTCDDEQPCPAATGVEAKTHLASLVGTVTGQASEGHFLVEGPTLQCRSEGGAGGTRTAAWCVSPSQGDLSCAMVASGKALRWDKYWHGHQCP